MRRGALFTVLFLGCSSHAEPSAPECPEHQTRHGEACVPDVPACDDRSIGAECTPIGVPSCADGFVADGSGGCTVTLPESCPAGELAYPGESSCHPVAECGSARYPDVPAGAVHVDASYVGASDGTADKPYSKIADAIASAPADGTIAIAAGTYVENLAITRSLHLVGRCPSMVTIAGAPEKTTNYTLDVIADATVRGLALTGPYHPISVRNGKVLLEHLWVHDAGDHGVDLQKPATADTEVTLRESLVEANKFAGVFILGARVTIERVVSRKNLPDADDTGGAGLQIGTWKKMPADPVTVRASVLEDNTFANLAVAGVKVSVDGSVLRRSLAEPSGAEAPGLGVYNDPGNANVGDVTVTSSLIAENRGVGVYVLGGRATLEKSVVRAQKSRASDDLGGDGVTVTRRGQLFLRDSLVEKNRHAGVLVAGAAATIERSIVRDTTEHGDGAFGVGIAFTIDGHFPSQGAITDTLVLRSRYLGVGVIGSTVTAERLLVRETEPQKSDGKYGDGVAVSTSAAPTGEVLGASFTTTDLVVTKSARASMSVFGADLVIERALLACGGFALEVSEDYTGRTADPRPFTLDPRGEIHCGCGTTWESCKAQSSGIEPVSLPR